MKKFFNLWAVIACLVFASCENDDPVIPADADDNFITNVTMTVDGTSYSAVIENNTITVTVPYTVSLNNAEVVFEYTPSATIMPDPTTITDWDTERTFRVTSYNGEANEYAYKVIKDDIRHEGNVELKTASDIAKFAETSTTIIKGNLIIGSDAENAEVISDISALSILKEVEGNVIIRNSYAGGTLTGLDNITTIGGLIIGSEENHSAITSLEMISMPKLNNVSGDIHVHGTEATIIEFNELETVAGQVVFNENTKLIQISLPMLREAGCIDFKKLPREFATLSVPELVTVNGDFNIESLFGNVSTGGMLINMANTALTSIVGLDKLTSVKGCLSVRNFDALEAMPQWDNLASVGSFDLTHVTLIETLDISHISFESFNNQKPQISINSCQKISNLVTKEDLSNVNVFIYSSGTHAVKTNFTSVNDLHYYSWIESCEFPVQTVKGNLIIQVNDSKTAQLLLPQLASVAGYCIIHNGGFNLTNIKAPVLESIGGEAYIKAGTDATLDFAMLKTVCCAETPVTIPSSFDEEIGREVIIIKYPQITGRVDGNIVLYADISKGSLTVNVDAAILNTYFPTLNRVGGSGLSLIQPYESASFPGLESIDGTFRFKCNQFLSSAALSMPKLTKLSGVHFHTVSKFEDFSFFKKFIDEGQITEDNWLIENCKYNPTYQDMKEGRYTQQ